MTVDFFEKTQDKLRSLNQTERGLYEYVVKNMQGVKDLSIQAFAKERFLSTTTIFRFVQKLGFQGYTDFINSLLVTTHVQGAQEISPALGQGKYWEEYLDNLMESVRVMSSKKMGEVLGKLEEKPPIYILTDHNSHAIGQYYERLFIGLGFRAYFPEAPYHTQHLVNHIKEEDLIIALSYSGEDTVLLDFIQRVFLKVRPYLLSVTRAENNLLQGLSDTNFYVFADEIHQGGLDLTSGVPMLVVLERLVYAHLNRQKDGAV